MRLALQPLLYTSYYHDGHNTTTTFRFELSSLIGLPSYIFQADFDMGRCGASPFIFRLGDAAALASSLIADI